MLYQFGKLPCVMVTRLTKRSRGEYSGYFRCLCVVYWFMNAFVHQNWKDFVHKNSKSPIYRFIRQ